MTAQLELMFPEEGSLSVWAQKALDRRLWPGLTTAVSAGAEIVIYAVSEGMHRRAGAPETAETVEPAG